jgi:hypothetical protein
MRCAKVNDLQSVALTWNSSQSNGAVLRRLQPADGALPDAVVAQAREILDAVRTHGDAALIDYSARFDKAELTSETIRVSLAEISASASQATPELRAAIDLAIANVRAFHALQKPRDVKREAQGGGLLELIWRPVAAAALYVPGGRAAYPSTVIMNAVPAIEAGVPRMRPQVLAAQVQLAKDQEGPRPSLDDQNWGDTFSSWGAWEGASSHQWRMVAVFFCRRIVWNGERLQVVLFGPRLVDPLLMDTQQDPVDRGLWPVHSLPPSHPAHRDR